MPNVTSTHTRLAFWRPQIRLSHALSKAEYPSLADRLITPQPTLRTDEGIFRTRKHGNKSLPMSPLLDEHSTKEKHRYTQPKAEYDPEKLTEFQKELALNPHGKLLYERAIANRMSIG